MYVVGETTGDHRFAFEQADGVRPFDLAVDQMFGSSPKTYMVDKTVERHYENVSYDVTKLNEYLRRVLQLEAVACKDWLTNKVDRSVTGKIARQQCQGELQLPLSDCGVVALDYRGENWYGLRWQKEWTAFHCQPTGCGLAVHRKVKTPVCTKQ